MFCFFPFLNKFFVTQFSDFKSDWQRTHYCCREDLYPLQEGDSVQLNGWIESIRELQKDNLFFMVLRDRKGTVQLLIDFNQYPQLRSQISLQTLRNVTQESVVWIKGNIKYRPQHQQKEEAETGKIEIIVQELVPLNTSSPLPFQMANAEENIRLKYRYLDLRRPQLQKNIIMRSTALGLIKQYFSSQNFLEIETPTLFKSTPEGAREFLVPTRQKGKFYALTQSPQQYKQLLMIGGLDRYFQIARCYRDESGRADRQPEFTQIDLEMSFITPKDIYSLIENLLKILWKQLINVDIQTPFIHMTYNDAMENYGIDKPDLRFDLKFKKLTDLFKDCQFAPLQNVSTHSNGFIYGFKAEKFGEAASRKLISELTTVAKQNGAQNLFCLKVVDDDNVSGSFAEKLSTEEKKQLIQRLNAKPGDFIAMVAENDWEDALTALGKVRLSAASMMQQLDLLFINPREFKFLWVDDFPLFARSAEGQGGLFDTTRDRGLVSMHHPFTSPHPDDLHYLESEPLKVRGLHYDCVVNGIELGGGSIRIHDAKLQQHILQDLLQLGEQRTRERFSHLLEALSYGAPPHGGIALGFDRLMVILAQALQKDHKQLLSLRDVIAFPKSANGNELMSQSPSYVEDRQLRELGLSVDKE